MPILAVVLVGALTWALVPEGSAEGRQDAGPFVAQPSGSAASLPAPAGAPAGAITPAGSPSARTGGFPAGGITAQGSTSPGATVPSTSGPGTRPPVDSTSTATATPSPAPSTSTPKGTLLTSGGGDVLAKCNAAGKSKLVAWEPKDGWKVSDVSAGPALTTGIVFERGLSKIRMTVTCVAGSPTAVILPL